MRKTTKEISPGGTHQPRDVSTERGFYGQIARPAPRVDTEAGTSVAGDAGFLSFSGTRNYLEVAASVGIIAVPVTLLLIAGEFDLSVGVMVGATGMAGAFTIVFLDGPL